MVQRLACVDSLSVFGNAYIADDNIDYK
jgi:hypothetical protein